MTEVMSYEQRQLAVWKVVSGIPYGKVMTYGQVAAQAGLGRAARSIGGVLRSAPDSLDLPWHRVINSKGEISFPKDSEDYQRQYKLLTSEDIAFTKGRINLRSYGLYSLVDKQLWVGFF